MERITSTITRDGGEGPAPGAQDTTVFNTSARMLREPSPLYYVVKRLIDVLLSLLGLVILMPVFLIVAICIKLDDGGSVLHFREVIGQGGKRFFALKLRTMIPDADAYLEQHPDLL